MTRYRSHNFYAHKSGISISRTVRSHALRGVIVMRLSLCQITTVQFPSSTRNIRSSESISDPHHHQYYYQKRSMGLTYIVKPNSIETLAMGTLWLRNGSQWHARRRLEKRGKFVLWFEPCHEDICGSVCVCVCVGGGSLYAYFIQTLHTFKWLALMPLPLDPPVATL